MRQKHPLLTELEDRFVSRDRIPYRKALSIFEAMWKEGIRLGTIPPDDPTEGLDVDIRIARLLNSCSRNSSPE